MSKIFALSKVKSVSDILVTSRDHTVFALAYPKHLKLFASPLAADYEEDNQDTLIHSSKDHQSSLLASKHSGNFQDWPVLHHNHESSAIQLFFDLFFVANLTAFTSSHEINNSRALVTYIGFFLLLWSTWIQIAIFDVRFSNDSVFERLCKALQFGVMIGLAVIAPDYATEVVSDAEGADLVVQALKSMAQIFMASRLVLACQYLVILFWIRRYTKARRVLFIHAASSFITAMLFLGVSYAVTSNNFHLVYYAWVPIIIVETFICFRIAAVAKFMSFKKTGIVERLGLLTLIILGEGVIGLCDSISRVRTDHSFTPDVIGMIICAIVILYFLWMMYFDQTETEHVGTHRQHFWIVCHLPFHLAILLTVEGVAQFSVWRKVTDLILPFANSMENYPPNLNRSDLAVYFNDTLQGLYSRFSQSTVEQTDLSAYFDIFNDPTTSIDQLLAAGYNITTAGIVFVCENFGIEPPQSDSADAADPATRFEQIYSSFVVVFLYFFIAAGLTLLFLALLFSLGRRNKVRGDYLSIILRVVVGLGLCLLTLMDVPSDKLSGNIGVFMASAWMLPTVAISYAFVVFFDNLLFSYERKIVLDHEKQGGGYMSVNRTPVLTPAVTTATLHSPMVLSPAVSTSAALSPTVPASAVRSPAVSTSTTLSPVVPTLAAHSPTGLRPAVLSPAESDFHSCRSV